MVLVLQAVHANLTRLGPELRHPPQACLATLDAITLVISHGHTALCPLDRPRIMLLGTANHILYCDVVVTPEILYPDEENDDNEKAILWSCSQ